MTMDPRPVKLLHIEDSVADRMLIAKLLGTRREYAFTIVRAATEITAVTELEKGGVDLIFLDFRLPMGDGLTCLKKLREIEPSVPVVMLSGVVTPELGAQCLQAGADRFLTKQDLSAAGLAQVVDQVLSRTSIRAGLLPFCKQFIETIGHQLRKSLDELADDARRGGITAADLTPLFESVCQDLAKQGVAGGAKLLRPVLLDLQKALSK